MLFDCVYDLSVTIYFIAILLNKNRWEIQKYKQMTFESYKFSHDSMILSVMQCNHAKVPCYSTNFFKFPQILEHVEI